MPYLGSSTYPGTSTFPGAYSGLLFTAGDLLTGLRNELVNAGIVRAPNDAGSEPPLWLEPRDGTPAPGEGDNATAVGSDAVLGAYLTGGVPTPPLFGQTRMDQVDIWIRTAKASRAFQLDASIRARLIDRLNFSLGGYYVVQSQQWRALTRLESGPQGYTFSVAYLFETVAA